MDFEDFENGDDAVEDIFNFSGVDNADQIREQRDSVIFLVDCSKSMFQPNPNNENQTSSIQAVLKACLSFMKTKIISSDSDKVGVIMYGCALTQNPLNFKNIAIIQNLDVGDAQMIKEFQNIEANVAAKLQPSGVKAHLYDALWICYQEFKAVEKQNYTKRIFLFTDDDCPETTDEDRAMTLQRANDLTQMNVDIELFPMPKPWVENDNQGLQKPPKFEIKSFYADVITFEEGEQDYADQIMGINGAQTRIFELLKRIKQKEFRKRAQGKCMFSLSPGSQIALSFYSQVMPAKKPTAAKVNLANNKQLRSTQRFICQETGSVLYRQQIGTYYPLGSEKVKMTTDEMNRIKKFDKVGMTLMGFKPKTYLKVYHNVKHSTFVYPDESRVQGSSQCMDALIAEMKRKDKIALVRVQVRDNAQVRFCALLPSEGTAENPGGFQLVVLPFADDIRDLDTIMEAAGFPQNENEVPIADTLTKKERDAAKLMISNLSIGFDSRNFENPTIQKFYSGLQALALGNEEPERVPDLLEPDQEGMKIFQPVMQNFKDTFFQPDNDSSHSESKNGRKPRNGKGRGGKPILVHERIVIDSDDGAEEVKHRLQQNPESQNQVQGKRATPDGASLDELDWRILTAFETNSLEKMKVGDLKDFAYQKSLLSKGTTAVKAKLIELIREFCIRTPT